MRFFQSSYGTLRQSQNMFSPQKGANLIIFYNNEQNKTIQKEEFIFRNNQWNREKFK